MSSPAPSMRRDVASAYAAVAARIGGLLLVSAAIYRGAGAEEFAVFNLIRATVGLLNYTGLGLGPAMVRMLAAAHRPSAAATVAESDPEFIADESGARVLAYATPSHADPLAKPSVDVYAAGEVTALLLGAAGLAFAIVHAKFTPELYGLTTPQLLAEDAFHLSLGLGVAIVLRLVSEPLGAVLQVNGRVALDNTLLALTEVFAAGMAAFAVRKGHNLTAVGYWYAVGAFFLLALRFVAARRAAPNVLAGSIWTARPNLSLLLQNTKALLAFGVLVTLAQLADYLYSPTDYLLINWLLTLKDVGDYAPAVQIDAGLLTLVTGLSAVVLPRAAVAHSGGNSEVVRRYYLKGTVASTALLLLAALAVWALSPWILKLWLGHDMPETRAILPLVLIHTVVGGSAAVGRSVLLGMGKVKPFTASVLIAGVANVVLSYVFVRYFGWGLRGIVLGTIIAVVARAGVWTPWYVMRTLRREERDGVTG